MRSNEVHLECDRCGAHIMSAGWSAKGVPRDLVFLVMEAVPLSRVSGERFDPHSGDVVAIGGNRRGLHQDPKNFAEVCPRCFAEFKLAMGRLKQWWDGGQRPLLSGAPKHGIGTVAATRSLRATAAIVKSRRGG